MRYIQKLLLPLIIIIFYLTIFYYNSLAFNVRNSISESRIETPASEITWQKIVALPIITGPINYPNVPNLTFPGGRIPVPININSVVEVGDSIIFAGYYRGKHPLNPQNTIDIPFISNQISPDNWAPNGQGIEGKESVKYVIYNNDRLLAQTTLYGLFYSLDKGKTWSPETCRGIGENCVIQQVTAIGFDYYVLAKKPDGKLNVYHRLCANGNDCQDWKEFSQNLPQNFGDATLAISDRNLILTARLPGQSDKDGHIFVTDKRLNMWKEVGPGGKYQLYSVGISGDYVYALYRCLESAGNGCPITPGFVVSKDGGKSWSYKELPVLSRFTSASSLVAFKNAVFVNYVGNLGTVYASSNQGDSWTRITEKLPYSQTEINIGINNLVGLVKGELYLTASDGIYKRDVSEFIFK